MFIALLSLVSACISLPAVFAGTLKPSGDYPVYHTISNKDENAHYNFTFIPETTIPVDSTLEVVFPPNYSPGLGISLVTSTTCSTLCSVNGYSVIFSITKELLAGVEVSFKVKNVRNPVNRGGTGNFQLITRKGINTLDENLIFGTIGIADGVGNLTSTIVSIDSSGSARAGDLTKYNFLFKTSRHIPWTSYFMLSMPENNGYGISQYPSCAAFAINGKIISGNFKCRSVDTDIIVEGLLQDIPPGSEVGLSVTVTNPPMSVISGSFKVSIFRMGTNVIYDWRTNIAGIQILPGKITGTSLKPILNGIYSSRKKVIDYELKFVPKNKLTKASIIYIECSSITYQIVQLSYEKCFIKYGVEDTSEDDPAIMIYDASSITISNMKEMEKPGEICIQCRLRNPEISGTVSPIKIRTYTDSTKNFVVDEDIVSAYTTIINMPSTVPANPAGIVFTNNLANAQLTDLTFSITTSVPMPQNCLIKINIPNEFTLGTIQSSNCPDSLSCTRKDNLVTLKMGAFNLNIAKTFRLTGLIYTPAYEGVFLFDITTYDSDGITPLESYSDYLTILPDTFATSSMKFLGLYTNKISIITVNFIVQLEIPSGKAQTKTTDIQGMIELTLDAKWNHLNTLYQDRAAFPCKAVTGIIPVLNQNIKCIIRTTTPPLIEVKNFQSMTTGTIVELHIPMTKNPTAGATTVFIRALKFQNRIKTILNQKSYTASVTSGSVSGGSTTTAYTKTSNLVSTLFSLTFVPQLTTSLTATHYVIVELPTYDTGFIPKEDTVTCFIKVAAANNFYPCIKYRDVDWILIMPTAAVTSNPSNEFTLKNLKWPRYTDSRAVGVVVYVIDSAGTLVEQQNCNTLPAPNPNAFVDYSTSVPKKGLSYVDCNYYFTFRAINSIPDYGSVVLTFPAGYSLQSSFPSPRFKAPQFSSVNELNPLTFTPNLNILTISNIKELPALSQFTISVEGIKNPPPPAAVASGWTIETFLNNKLINQKSNFDSFPYGSEYVSGTIIFNEIYSFPSNANERATYYIKFTPITEIPAYGEIFISFPASQFKITFSGKPLCGISGGITTFSSCKLIGYNTFSIKTDTKYTTGSITFSVIDIVNPEEGTSDGFFIETKYDGVTLDTTDSGSTFGRTVTTSGRPYPITMSFFDFKPKNEGELSTYTFVFTPKSVITTDMQLYFEFPLTYDRLLGISPTCRALSGITGDLKCLISNRALIVSQLDPYIPSSFNPITIEIYNIVNPNRLDRVLSNNIRIGTFKQYTNHFIDFNNAAASPEISAAPGWAYLYNITSTNLYARIKANYTFNFSITSNLPKQSSNGFIFVDLPSQFEIAEANSICTSPSVSLSPSLGCNILRNRVYISGNENDASGNLVVKVDLIENPIMEGRAGNIFVVTYDGFNNLVLEKSYQNLDPFKFAYTYPGPLITVNGDQDITVERGSQTKDLYITLEYPCALNLTFQPIIDGFYLVPKQIKLSLAEIKTKIRVSIPQNLEEGTYYIKWVTLGDQDPPIYTPLKKTKVIVSKIGDIRVDKTPLYEIPFGGNSLPVTFETPYAPQLGFEVIISMLGSYPGITLEPKNVIFSAGSNAESFRLVSSNLTADTNGTRVSRGQLSFILSGVNKGIYQLTELGADFTIIDPDDEYPIITELLISDIQQTSVILTVGCSEIASIFYMIALKGTERPPYLEVKNQGPAPMNSTRSIYGGAVVGKSNRININVTGLTAQTPYSVYVYIEDRGWNSPNTSKSIEFTTLARHRAADISLRFKQIYLNNAEKKNIMTYVAFVLSLPVSKVQERKFIFYEVNRVLEEKEEHQGSARNLVEDVTYVLYLQIISIPETEVFPKPKLLGDLLSTKMETLNKLLTNFDMSYKITSKEFVPYIPEFVGDPTFKDIGQYHCECAVKLTNYGWVFATSVAALKDKSKPSAWQIYQGLSSINAKEPSKMIEISEKFIDFYVKVENLLPDTEYNLYIVGGSAHPGYPDLMDDKMIKLLTFKTLPADIIPHLNINAAERTEYVGLALLLIFLLLLHV